jgi:hypothetical protein
LADRESAIYMSANFLIDNTFVCINK